MADEAESVVAWLRETATVAALSAPVMEQVLRDRDTLQIEADHVRNLVSRAIEWRIAGVLIERANPEEVTDEAREALILAEQELGTAVENMLDDSLGTPKKRKG